MHLFYTWIKSKRKNNLIKTFIKLGNRPELINSDDKNTLEFRVKTADFGNIKDIEYIGFKEMRKLQFTQSTSKSLMVLIH